MKIILTLTTTLSLFFAIKAWAGPSTSGGGFAVVCRDSSKNIKTAELLDLYEAKNVYGFEIMPSYADEMFMYVNAVSNGYRLQGYHPPISQAEMEKNVLNFYKIVKWLPESEKLPNLNDLGSQVSVPAGCAIEPLAIFYDAQNTVVIDKQIWSSLNSLSRAALVLHEISYNLFRQMSINPDTNSIDTRVLTASFFSINLTPVNSGIPTNSKPIMLFANRSEATDYHKLSLGTDGNGIQKFRLQLTHLAGRPLLSMTTIDIPQAVNFGDVYSLKSMQLRGWTAKVAQDKTRHGGMAVKLLVRRGTELMVEIPL